MNWFMVKSHTSDIRMTYEDIRVTFRWHASTYEWHTDDIRVNASDILMTYEYIRVRYHCIQVHTSDIQMTYEYTYDIRAHTSDTSDMRVHTSDIQITYMWHTSTYSWHTNDIRMTWEILNRVKNLELLDSNFQHYFWQKHCFRWLQMIFGYYSDSHTFY